MSIESIGISDELKQSYLDYAMSVIVSRALPDVRDGLKPVHRRILYAMHELSNDHAHPHKKSARVVGDVIGKYHPHGDTAVYDAIVRLAQPFSLRYPLIDGQGNFGSMDGDPPAAMRYTEVRMLKLTQHLLNDLDKDTVDWEPNYDGSETMPSVLPAAIPNLLVNGATGIAVGMATNMAPHHLGEVLEACLAYCDDTDISIDELCAYIQGPDFPTGGVIYGKNGIIDAYKTGKGRLYLRGRYHFEEMEKERTRIVFDEIPYQINKANLIKYIADLANDKKIEGISEIRDESDKDGVRVVIELRRGQSAEVVVNNLFKQTPLETSFSINMVALDNGQPKLLNLKQLIAGFVRHRQEVVTRRTEFDLQKALARGHLLEGLAVALANIDEIIAIIKSAPNRAGAKDALMAKDFIANAVIAMLERAGSDPLRPKVIDGENPNRPFGLDGKNYRLSGEQAQAILDMQLHRLTGLEQDKLTAEYQDILQKIAYLRTILADFTILMGVIKDEMRAIKDNFNEPRRTDIVHAREDFSRADLIPEQQIVLTISRTGYAKTQPVSDYSVQNRGGRGKSATAVKEDDVIDQLLVTSTHDTVLLFSNQGRVFALRGFEIPLASRGAKGRPLVNLLQLDDGERITALLSVDGDLRTNLDESADDELDDNTDGDDSDTIGYDSVGDSVFFATKDGVVKRVGLVKFARAGKRPLIAINLDAGDELVAVARTTGNQEIMLFASTGRAVRFSERLVRQMGRTSRGVRGIKTDGGVVKSLVVLDGRDELLIASENGFGKRTQVDEFVAKGRGIRGVIAIKTSERNGLLADAILVADSDDVVMMTDKGTLVRTRVAQIAQTGRNAQGVRLMRPPEGERLISLASTQADETLDESELAVPELIEGADDIDDSDE